jgi:hypothetical protein
MVLADTFVSASGRSEIVRPDRSCLDDHSSKRLRDYAIVHLLTAWAARTYFYDRLVEQRNRSADTEVPPIPSSNCLASTPLV